MLVIISLHVCYCKKPTVKYLIATSAVILYATPTPQSFTLWMSTKNDDGGERQRGELGDVGVLEWDGNPSLARWNISPLREKTHTDTKLQLSLISQVKPQSHNTLDWWLTCFTTSLQLHRDPVQTRYQQQPSWLHVDGSEYRTPSFIRSFRGGLGCVWPHFLSVYIRRRSTERVTTTSPDSINKCGDFKRCFMRRNFNKLCEMFTTISKSSEPSCKFSIESEH